MSRHELQLSDLQALCTQSVSITYNCDAADTLELSMRPEAYAELGFKPNDRIVLNHEGNTVFSGTLLTGSTHSVQAGGGEDVQLHAESDLGLLERMAYVKKNASDEFLFPGVTEPFVDSHYFSHEVFNRMKDWEGSPIESFFFCGVDERVPTPEGNGATPAGALLQDLMKWVPEAVLFTSYGPAGSALDLCLRYSSDLTPLSLPTDAPIQAVALTARPDLVPPVCALVGGDTYQFPAGVDVRTPGAFVYPVPVDRDGSNDRAGSKENSQKMVVRGIPLPERTQFVRGEDEYEYSPIVAPSRTCSFISRFFPQYTKFMGACEVGAAVLSVVTREQLEAEAEQEAEYNGDEDAQPIPANYSDDPSGWSAAPGGNGVYVMTEGSFPASSRSTKNLRGLRWCKGSVTLMLRLMFKNKDAVPAELREAVPTLFPGKARYWSKEDRKWRSAWLARLTVDCVLINRRLRVYDAATTQPCTTDPNYSPEEDGKPTASDYRAAMEAYYKATHPNGQPLVPYEGSINLLHDGYLQPQKMAGHPITIHGKRPEWATMHAVVRSVTWEYGQKKLSIDVGSRAVLGFEDYLARRMLAKADRRRTLQRMTVPFSVSDPEERLRAESNMSVSPSVNASVSATPTGIHRKPGTLYEVGIGSGDSAQSTVWLAGGTLRRNGQTFNVPDTDRQIIRGQASESGWTWGVKVKLKWETVAGELTYSIYQDFK